MAFQGNVIDDGGFTPNNSQNQKAQTFSDDVWDAPTPSVNDTASRIPSVDSPEINSLKDFIDQNKQEAQDRNPSADIGNGATDVNNPVGADGNVSGSFDEYKSLIADLLAKLGLGSTTGIADVISSICARLRSNDYTNALSNGEKVQLASTIFNSLYDYSMQRLQMLWNQQNWTFQQQYNSPANQIKRLVEAGVNPAFYYGVLESSTAQSQANTPQSNGSSVGYTPQENQNAIGRISGITGAVASIGGLINPIVGASLGIAKSGSEIALNEENARNLATNAWQIESMTPHQIAVLEAQRATYMAQTRAMDAKTPAEVKSLESDAAYKRSQVRLNANSIRSSHAQICMQASELSTRLAVAAESIGMEKRVANAHNITQWAIANNGNEAMLLEHCLGHLTKTTYGVHTSWESLLREMGMTNYSKHGDYISFGAGADAHFGKESSSSRSNGATENNPQAKHNDPNKRVEGAVDGRNRNYNATDSKSNGAGASAGVNFGVGDYSESNFGKSLTQQNENGIAKKYGFETMNDLVTFCDDLLPRLQEAYGQAMSRYATISHDELTSIRATYMAVMEDLTKMVDECFSSGLSRKMIESLQPFMDEDLGNMPLSERANDMYGVQ